ncbi:hypothetical protein AX15_004506 [Amanita polypyramis BW_CC]|nr:hypothetical protein AX15_004506 [Amanita polypyramis BW_CC]
MVIETNIHVRNLHCYSCVHAIKELLNRLSPTPSSVNSSTDSRSVQIIHEQALSLQTLQHVLLDAGFDIRVESSKSLDETASSNDYESSILTGKSGMHEQYCRWCRRNPDASHSTLTFTQPTNHAVEQEADNKEQISTPDQYKLTLAIGGMTCASCTITINENLANIAGVHDVSVNLIENSATCKLVGDQLADIVCSTIEECGYEAQIVSMESESKNTSPGEITTLRTVAFRVEGLSSSQCPKKVMSAVESMGDQVTIEKVLTSQTDPILVVSYVPDLPSFSIRNIVAAIQSSNDPPYRVTIHRPPTLEYLTRTVQAREKRQMLSRLVFAVIAAIPTFILGVVYMSLVKDENPGKRYLMEPIWAGNASRLEWALLFISTPVMFYSANIFHHKNIKEIMALWRRASSATMLQRLTRFGSMNLLVSSGVSVAYFSSLALFIIAATSHRSDRSDNMTYFNTVVFLTMFLLAGRCIEVTSKTRTADAINALSALQPGEALKGNRGSSRG